MSASRLAADVAVGTGLVDTHCHLALLDDRGLLDASLEAAEAAGVEQIISVGLNVEDSDRNRQIAEAHANVFFTVGWHPTEKAPPDSHQVAALAELLHHPKAVAVGEIGLDGYFRPGYHETPLDVQVESLRAMCELAEAHSKPIIVHDRDTHDQVLAELAGFPAVTGVMHCFSGDAEFGARCVARGMYLSFAGTVTFPRSEGIQAAAIHVPDTMFVVETDAPFLAPVPHRGRPNQPAYVVATAARVAELRGVDVSVVAQTAGRNARTLFALPDPQVT